MKPFKFESIKTMNKYSIRKKVDQQAFGCILSVQYN